MGRSSSSCLNIIACGTQPATLDDDDIHDDVPPPQAKALGDKRGWTFRKRSGRHQALGNNVSPETITAKDKETPAGVNVAFQVPVKPLSLEEKSLPPKSDEKKTEAEFATENVSESKTPVVSSSENDGSAENIEFKTYPAEVIVENGNSATSAEAKTSMPAVVSGNGSDTGLAGPNISNSMMVSEVNTNTTTSAESETDESVAASQNGGVADAIMDEPVAIVIQTAVREFLAQKTIVQLKSAIKLQAAIRGHLVRRNAVETFYCIRAIVKVQSLVRARSSKLLDQKDKVSDARFSTVKLLRNGFARQLLKSTPRPKSVNIRCDPLRPNSAWAWLERWMSVSEHTVESDENRHDRSNSVQEDAELGQLVHSELVTSTFNTADMTKSPDNEENSIISDETEQPHPQKSDIIEDDVACLRLDTLANQSSQMQAKPVSLYDNSTLDGEQPKLSTKRPALKQLDGEGNQISQMQAEPVSLNDNSILDSEQPKLSTKRPALEQLDGEGYGSSQMQAEPVSLNDNSTLDSEEPKLSTKRPALEQLDGEGKKFAHGSKKASSPAFIAAHSKFKELSAAVKPGGSSVSSSHQDVGADSYVETALPAEETLEKTYESASIKIAPFDPQSQVTGFECRTEVPISSTLDSPNISNIENSEFGNKKSLEETYYDASDKEGQGGVANGLSDLENSEVEKTKSLEMYHDVSSNDGPSGVANGISKLRNSEVENENSLEEMCHDVSSKQGPGGETSGLSRHCLTDLSPAIIQQEEACTDNGISGDPPVAQLSVQEEQKLEIKKSDLQTNTENVNLKITDSSQMEPKRELNNMGSQLEDGSATEHQGHKVSPETSPKNHKTALESQGTPPSQVSVKGKKKKTEKSGSNTKRSTVSGGKRLPSNRNLDSGASSSTENLPKEQKSGKRRNSLGSSKSDNVEQEPRDSNSRNSLPSYMQATESAKAKTHSPKSSPDVHDKEVSSKKRHSLPGVSGKLTSPRFKSSTSQTANSSNDTKWLR